MEHEQAITHRTERYAEQTACEEVTFTAQVASSAETAVERLDAVGGRLLRAIGRMQGGLPDGSKSGNDVAKRVRSSGTLHHTKEALSEVHDQLDSIEGLLGVLEQIA